MNEVSFERFAIAMPEGAVGDCSHSGDCTADVEHWAARIARPADCSPATLAAELREYGA